ncbi:hypothetical protein THAR02_09577 [Trichoderma harzianum]|uniref:Uncharacterized protein n=1 Tax=Trichoderma harzianum TaxID=5544 RepID=A0A0F9ZYL4_TRIHA|nr:hypothetical protein THAR02_09577 [Trichoderma harzianum]
MAKAVAAEPSPQIKAHSSSSSHNSTPTSPTPPLLRTTPPRISDPNSHTASTSSVTPKKTPTPKSEHSNAAMADGDLQGNEGARLENLQGFDENAPATMRIIALLWAHTLKDMRRTPAPSTVPAPREQTLRTQDLVFSFFLPPPVFQNVP